MKHERPFHILALSGGGFRGMFTAQILADIEEAIGEPIARRFDLIAGTSIGGIIALALACEIPASTIVANFKEYGPNIFRSPWIVGLLQFLKTRQLPPMQRFSAMGYLSSTYSADDLKAMLAREALFGNRTLGFASHPVVIPTVNYTTGLPVMFKTPHHINFREDHKRQMVDIALATSAAPTYFPRHIVAGSEYVDGGLYANAPGLVALHEALQFFDADWEQIGMLSIGTMSSKLTGDPGQNRRGGMLGWGGPNPVNTPKKLFNLAISSQESITNFIVQHRLGTRYFHIDEILTGDKARAVGLDKASPSAIQALEGSAKQASKAALGREAVRSFLEHRAAPAVFYHGPLANSIDGV